MSRKMPQVREYMTLAPVTIAANCPLTTIRAMMRDYGVRHLPVKRNGDIVGIVSDRSVKSALAAGRGTLTAEDVMVTDPFWVTPDTELDLVVAEMAEEKYGSALVKDDWGNLLGIFTTIDACHALRQILETFYPE